MLIVKEAITGVGLWFKRPILCVPAQQIQKGSQAHRQKKLECVFAIDGNFHNSSGEILMCSFCVWIPKLRSEMHKHKVQQAGQLLWKSWQTLGTFSCQCVT